MSCLNANATINWNKHDTPWCIPWALRYEEVKSAMLNFEDDFQTQVHFWTRFMNNWSKWMNSAKRESTVMILNAQVKNPYCNRGHDSSLARVRIWRRRSRERVAAFEMSASFSLRAASNPFAWARVLEDPLWMFGPKARTNWDSTSRIGLAPLRRGPCSFFLLFFLDYLLVIFVN